MSDRKRATLFIHGIGGHIKQFKNWPEICSAYGDAETFFLPGHGGEFADLLKVNMATFQEDVDRRIRKLAATHDDIVLVGHSMGTLLALYAAARYPEQIRGLFLWAVPVEISFPGSTARVLRYHFGAGRPSFKVDIRDIFSVTMPTPRQAIKLLPLLNEIISYSRRVKVVYPTIDLPITIFQVEKDELISSEKSTRFLRSNPRASVTVLHNSAHGYLASPDDELVCQTLRSFQESL